MRKMTEKQIETLNRMKDTRKQDYLFLREIVKDKLKWAKEQKEEGLKQLDSLKNQLENLQDKIKKLEGAIIVLEELSHAKIEEKEKAEQNG